ncbi:MAG: aminomethyl-transferring glycine dehydrogenase subunit GcvPA [Armatimonadetes bacterium]|nr:aminomethyl-transferring glycine dehydrogenase subunit GcvPA [Armatimonadota bacterium]MBS1712005.1 aminomethyl-transferring glycine dehydrogenase subunit GcvPA [Armatimonadota bacterium]MBX3109441.1 aminomethyl-transferring glycine dehydrogenase subunit GcvPA [Fimbriimonadaceae bacterium]
MPYIPHTEKDVEEMLATIGVESIDDLFQDIPENLKLKGELNLPSKLDEHALLGRLQALSEQNTDLSRVVCFLGAGIYDRFIPATVGAVISRGEFLTAYTPYQPEASQGYLQTIYEFQSMVAELYGMDLANASMYDGATSMAEAAIMATGVKNRGRVACARAVHPNYRKVLGTYTWSMDVAVDELPDDNGATSDYSKLTEDHAALIVQYPNFYGVIEDLAAARAAADRVGALLIVVADPTACAILPPPGDFGADIVVGEGQPLGIPMGYGGPLLGLFACKEEFVRLIPGRIVGRTSDAQGREGFTMTLRTREQDIRREKATSNICTNEALMALASTVYMAALGKNGMRQVAETTIRNTQYAIQQLTQTGAKMRFGGKVFGEFVLELPKSAESVRDGLLQRGILAGLPLGPYDPTLENCLLVAVTEIRTKDQIDDYANKLRAELSH